MRWAPAWAGLSVALMGCVNQADLDSWNGQPSYLLDRHPVFLTMQLVRTMTPDGIEVRNYVNGGNISRCGGGGAVYGSDTVTYSQFSSCVQSFAACNNIFYIRAGTVLQYTPVGSGGARCYTDSSLRPGMSGPLISR